MSGRPDAAAQEAARNLEERKRMREIEEAILERAPENDIGPSLERIAAVMELAGDPQRTYPVIHLTGTNGKTSTSRMIDSILQESGLSTGRFTSPHLHDIRILAGERDLRTYGSQGEQRSAVLALVLAEAETLAERTGSSPLVLLDDVLSELDEDRRAALAELVAGLEQTVITATSAAALPVEAAQSLVVSPGRVVRG